VDTRVLRGEIFYFTKLYNEFERKEHLKFSRMFRAQTVASLSREQYSFFVFFFMVKFCERPKKTHLTPKMMAIVQNVFERLEK